MNIGIPKEKRPSEYRVGLSPAGVQMLTEHGHTCYVEHDAGLGAGFPDRDYERVGGHVVYSPHEAYGRADLVVKIARPLEEELEWLRQGSALAGFLHLPSARQSKIDTLLEKEITAIAFEQVQLIDGSLPVLRPLSEIGGRLAAQIAASLMQNNYGGKGILLGGMPGVPPAEVVIIGAGVVGTFAAGAFLGMGAQVTILDSDPEALQRVHDMFPPAVTMFSNPPNIERASSFADVLITCAMIPGRRAPVLVTREMVVGMRPRALIMDISIDQGGCVETSRPTTHEKPTFVEEEVIHYCVPNMPAVVARTASHAFINAALPFILDLADNGIEVTITEKWPLKQATNTHKGEIRRLARLSPTNNG